MQPTINPYDALKRMRELTQLGIPFSFEFVSYNSSNRTSDGFKKVINAQLRKSYRSDQSDKSNVLIGYVNGNDDNRWFYLPLLMKFNGYLIKP